MSQSCGMPLEFVDGGVLRNTTVIGAQITDSRISNSVIDGCEITNLKSIDSASALVIARAIADNPTAMQILAEALFQEATMTPAGNPAVSTDTPLSTVMMGSRDVLLGKPFMFAKLGQFIIPVYREGM